MYSLIATTTVLPSLKSAREFCSKPRTPQVMSSGTFDECWNHALQIGGTGRIYSDQIAVRNGLPVFQTGDWTYWIVCVKIENPKSKELNASSYERSAAQVSRALKW